MIDIKGITKSLRLRHRCKPGQQVAVSGDINSHAATVVRFEGELAEWAT